MKTIWIDICHPPQAVFYIPIALILKRKGYALLITVQENQESFALLKNAGLDFIPAGKKYGRNRFLKSWGLLERSIKLSNIVRSARIWIGVSQGSPYQIVVCRILGIPNVAVGDNEHTDWFFVKFAQKLILPEAIPEWAIRVPMNRVYRLKGLKEEAYLSGFIPDPLFPAKQGWKSSFLYVTLRPPARQAQYHHAFTENFFNLLVSRLLAIKNLCIVFLPRSQSDTETLFGRFPGIGSRLVVPDKVVDGLNLVYHSDAVFSGGGTMSREAALLGVPAYSYFQGNSLAVDRYLIRKGRLHWIRNESDIEKLNVKKRNRFRQMTSVGNPLIGTIVEEILSVRIRKHSA
jgi:predicted glycosyltransferase